MKVNVLQMLLVSSSCFALQLEIDTIHIYKYNCNYLDTAPAEFPLQAILRDSIVIDSINYNVLQSFDTFTLVPVYSIYQYVGCNNYCPSSAILMPPIEFHSNRIATIASPIILHQDSALDIGFLNIRICHYDSLILGKASGQRDILIKMTFYSGNEIDSLLIFAQQWLPASIINSTIAEIKSPMNRIGTQMFYDLLGRNKHSSFQKPSGIYINLSKKKLIIKK